MNSLTTNKIAHNQPTSNLVTHHKKDTSHHNKPQPTAEPILLSDIIAPDQMELLFEPTLQTKLNPVVNQASSSPDPFHTYLYAEISKELNAFGINEFSLSINGSHEIINATIQGSEAIFNQAVFSYPQELNMPLDIHCDLDGLPVGSFANFIINLSPLHVITSMGYYDGTKLLIENGADVNNVMHIGGNVQFNIGTFNDTPWIVNKFFDESISLAECFLDLFEENMSYKQQLEMLELLIDNGLDLTTVNNEHMDLLLNQINIYQPEGVAMAQLIYQNAPNYNWNECSYYAKNILNACVECDNLNANIIKIDDVLLSGDLSELLGPTNCPEKLSSSELFSTNIQENILPTPISFDGQPMPEVDLDLTLIM